VPRTALSRAKPTRKGRVVRVIDEPLTPRELAAFLKVSPVTVRRLLANKELPYFRVGRQVRFVPSEVLRALKDQK